MTRLALLCLILSFAHNANSQTNCPASLPDDICQFETKVYTDVDFTNTQDVRQTMVHLKTLMMSHSSDSPMIQERILDLANKIVGEAFRRRAPKQILAEADGKGNLMKMLKNLRKWEAKHGQIVPLDWNLPAGFIISITALERSYDVSTDRVRYALSIFAPVERPLEIEQLKVNRYGGPTVIDKLTGVGDSGQGILRGMRYVSASSPRQDTPMPDGLYLMTIKVKGQKAVDGWFFLSGTPTSGPVILNPQVNESFRMSQPEFHFQDFKSNSLLPSDSRKRSIYVFRESDNANVWKASTINPLKGNSVKMGREPNQTGPSDLEPGSYRLSVTFEERSYFGDITIGRLVKTTVPFRVSK